MLCFDHCVYRHIHTRREWLAELGKGERRRTKRIQSVEVLLGIICASFSHSFPRRRQHSLRNWVSFCLSKLHIFHPFPFTSHSMFHVPYRVRVYVTRSTHTCTHRETSLLNTFTIFPLSFRLISYFFHLKGIIFASYFLSGSLALHSPAHNAFRFFSSFFLLYLVRSTIIFVILFELYVSRLP